MHARSAAADEIPTDWKEVPPMTRTRAFAGLMNPMFARNDEPYKDSCRRGKAIPYGHGAARPDIAANSVLSSRSPKKMTRPRQQGRLKIAKQVMSRQDTLVRRDIGREVVRIGLARGVRS